MSNDLATGRRRRFDRAGSTTENHAPRSSPVERVAATPRKQWHNSNHMPGARNVATNRLSARTRIGAGGRIVIPQPMREALGVKEGDDLLLEVDESGLHLRSVRQAVKLAQQSVAKYVKPGRSLAAELIAERRREAKRE